MRETNKPPETIPSDLRNDYTLSGRIAIGCLYLDDSRSPTEPLVYKKNVIDSYVERVKNKETFYYGATDSWLYRALEKHPIQGDTVAVLGSVVPLYESVCLCYGGKPTTIEYNKIISEDARVKTLTPAEYEKTPVVFDAAFSISSFEHDGLGRYGDPLNPNGDIDAMKKMKRVLKPGGLLFLSVPVGKDTLVWNAHRIYGELRLPMLLEGWSILDSFGFDKYRFFHDRDHTYQPVFVLQNSNASNLHLDLTYDWKLLAKATIKKLKRMITGLSKPIRRSNKK